MSWLPWPSRSMRQSNVNLRIWLWRPRNQIWFVLISKWYSPKTWSKTVWALTSTLCSASATLLSRVYSSPCCSDLMRGTLEHKQFGTRNLKSSKFKPQPQLTNLLLLVFYRLHSSFVLYNLRHACVQACSSKSSHTITLILVWISSTFWLFLNHHWCFVGLIDCIDFVYNSGLKAVRDLYTV